MNTKAAKSKKTGKPPGRPKGSDKYDPAMDELVMKLGRDGASKTEMAAACDVARSTLDAWADTHPSFKEAMALALTYAQAWWEARGRRGIGEGKEFNAVAYTMIMRNRFRDDYTEKQTIKHEGDSFREFLAFAHSRAGKYVGPKNPHAEGGDDAQANS
jgi:hypothetical protein